MRSILGSTLVTLSSQFLLEETIRELIDRGNVNIFNFDEPMYGDIYGFSIELGCEEDCDCGTIEEYTCPES